VKSVLEGGRGLLLIDGVDEVPRKLRRLVREDIEGLVKTYGDSTYVLTTRPAAIASTWLKHLGFNTTEVSPLSPVDRDQLIDRWHEAVARQLEMVGRPSAELAELARDLKASLRENSAIARLATNPLLAAAICALHRQRNRRLPETQADLSEDLCKMLLHQRESETENLSADPATYRVLTYPQKKRIVETLAYDMVVNGRSVLDKAEAQRRIGETLARMGRSDTESAEVLEGLVERSGMLREMSPGKLDFIHNTFKEYLAAMVLASERADGHLAKNALDPSWQQVLVFTAARGEQGFVERLIERVLGDEEKAQAASSQGKSKSKSKNRPHSREERQGQLMAVRLEAAALELRPELRKRVDALRKELFPPASMTEAEALATAGDAVVPYLKYRRQVGARGLAACVRTLRLIGSPAARDCLKGYLEDERWTVALELAQAVDPLDVRVIRETIMSWSGLPLGIRSQLARLDSIDLIKHAESLNFQGTRLEDAKPLAGLSSLRRLSLAETPIFDISPLIALRKLQVLNLAATQVNDISPLIKLKELEDLHLGDSRVDTIEPLRKSFSLKTLFLCRTKIRSIEALADLVELITLHLDGSDVRSFEPLSKLTKLQVLHLDSTTISDIDVLSGLGRLRELHLDGTAVRKLHALSGALELQELHLSSTNIKDLSPIENLSELSFLDLAATPISNVDQLACFNKLKTLIIDFTQVTDLEPLAHLPSLTTLSLRGVPTNNFAPLRKLPSLSEVILSRGQEANGLPESVIAIMR
jgi:hypothetical protein